MSVTRSTASAFPLVGVSTASVSNVTFGPQGDIVIVTVDWLTSGPTSLANTGSPLTWTPACLGSWGSYGCTTYVATVTAAAAGQTCTITASGQSGTTYIIVDELVSGLGTGTAWIVSNNNPTNPASSTTAAFSTVTTGSSGTLAYYGTIWGSQSASSGVTPVNGAAFTYTFGSDYGVAFSGAVVASTSYSPTATFASSATNAANAITVSASAPSSGPFAPTMGWLAVLNSLAGTNNLGELGAANAYAGTKNLGLLAALNAKAGTKNLELDAVCNSIAGTKGLSALNALNQAAGV